MTMRPKLAAYLRQRAELGEREIVLDEVDRDQALDALRAADSTPRQGGEAPRPHTSPNASPRQASVNRELAREHDAPSNVLASSHDIPNSPSEPVSSGGADLKKGLVVG